MIQCLGYCLIINSDPNLIEACGASDGLRSLVVHVLLEYVWLTSSSLPLFNGFSICE